MEQEINEKWLKPCDLDLLYSLIDRASVPQKLLVLRKAVDDLEKFNQTP